MTKVKLGRYAETGYSDAVELEVEVVERASGITLMTQGGATAGYRVDLQLQPDEAELLAAALQNAAKAHRSRKS